MRLKVGFEKQLRKKALRLLTAVIQLYTVAVTETCSIGTGIRVKLRLMLDKRVKSRARTFKD